MSTENIEQPDQESSEVLSAAAIARRHALLKGLSRGSVVLAAATPISTLANQTVLTFDNRVCSLSGWQSVVTTSRSTSTLKCEGYSPGWWKQHKKTGEYALNWPSLPNGLNYNSQCKSVFSRFGHDCSLFDALWDHPNDVHYHWICAWLNALDTSGHTINFPYNANQVMTFYHNNDQNALAFFTNYLEHQKAPNV